MSDKCPKFIRDRMDRLKLQPPPTPEEVDTQMKASIAIRKKLDTPSPDTVEAGEKKSPAVKRCGTCEHGYDTSHDCSGCGPAAEKWEPPSNPTT